MNNELIKESDEKDLRKLFNREFTDGYLFNNKNIMNMKTPNHQGIVIGKVIDYNKKKIKIKLTDDLMQEDGIRFSDCDKGMIVNYLYDERGNLIHEANKVSIVYVLNKVNLSSFDTVRKTLDKKLSKELDKYDEKKILIKMNIIVNNKMFILKVSDGVNVVEKSMEVEKSIKRRTTKEEVLKQMNRLNNTPFVLGDISISLDDDLFIPVSKMNEIRRECVNELIIKRMG